MLFDLYNLHFVLGYVHLFLALILNSFLIYLIKYETVSALGSYRHLLTLMSVYEINYAVAHAITSPVIYTTDSFVLVFIDGFIVRRLNPTVAQLLQVYIECSYSASMVILTVHFVYRYVNICKKHLMFLFESVPGILFTSCVMLFLIALWGGVCWVFFNPTPKRSARVAELVETVFHLNIYDMAYSLMEYKSLVPVLTIYLPCLVIFYGPFFGIGIYQYGTWMQILGSVNPVIDPIVVMYFIGDYRKATSRIVRRYLLRQNVICPQGTSTTNGPTATASTGRHLPPFGRSGQ